MISRHRYGILYMDNNLYKVYANRSFSLYMTSCLSAEHVLCMYAGACMTMRRDAWAPCLAVSYAAKRHTHSVYSEYRPQPLAATRESAADDMFTIIQSFRSPSSILNHVWYCILSAGDNPQVQHLFQHFDPVHYCITIKYTIVDTHTFHSYFTCTGLNSLRDSPGELTPLNLILWSRPDVSSLPGLPQDLVRSFLSHELSHLIWCLVTGGVSKTKGERVI
ncbi:hypothetical protein J6590_052006 [Homalodisca vitripennis]|nr:hypothetical protein J6590_052006 [Homalodisca vitripennis]